MHKVVVVTSCVFIKLALSVRRIKVWVLYIFLMEKGMKKNLVVLLSFFVLNSFSLFAQEDKDKGLYEDRIKIGFAKFDNKSQAVSKSNFGGYRAVQFDVEAFTTMITTALVKTRRFEVIERQDLDKLLAEQGLAEAGVVAEDLAAVSGHIRGVQFLMMGTVTKCGFTEKPIQVGSYKQTKKILELGIDFKVVNTSTGNIALSDFVEVNEEATSQIAGNGYSTNNTSENFIPNAMRKASLQAAFLVANSIVPLLVEDVNSGKKVVKLNYGHGFIEKDQYYRIFPSDEGGDGWDASFDEIGKVKITTVNPTYAIATIVEGNVDSISMGCVVTKIPPDEEKKLREKEKIKENDSMSKRFGY